MLKKKIWRNVINGVDFWLEKEQNVINGVDIWHEKEQNVINGEDMWQCVAAREKSLLPTSET